MPRAFIRSFTVISILYTSFHSTLQYKHKKLVDVNWVRENITRPVACFRVKVNKGAFLLRNCKIVVVQFHVILAAKCKLFLKTELTE